MDYQLETQKTELELQVFHETDLSLLPVNMNFLVPAKAPSILSDAFFFSPFRTSSASWYSPLTLYVPILSVSHHSSSPSAFSAMSQALQTPIIYLLFTILSFFSYIYIFRGARFYLAENPRFTLHQCGEAKAGTQSSCSHHIQSGAEKRMHVCVCSASLLFFIPFMTTYRRRELSVLQHDFYLFS